MAQPGPAFSRLDRLLPIKPRATPTRTYIVYRSCVQDRRGARRPQYFSNLGPFANENQK